MIERLRNVRLQLGQLSPDVPNVSEARKVPNPSEVPPVVAQLPKDSAGAGVAASGKHAIQRPDPDEAPRQALDVPAPVQAGRSGEPASLALEQVGKQVKESVCEDHDALFEDLGEDLIAWSQGLQVDDVVSNFPF